MAQSDYDTNDLDLLREIATRSDQRVSAQLTTAIAADQKAMTFAGFLAAAAAVLGGAAASVLSHTDTNHHLGVVALAAGVVTLLAFAASVYAARPVQFWSPGSVPKYWRQDISGKLDEKARLMSLLHDYDERIAKNEAVMSLNATIVRVASISLFAGYAICGGDLARRALF